MTHESAGGHVALLEALAGADTTHAFLLLLTFSSLASLFPSTDKVLHSADIWQGQGPQPLTYYLLDSWATSH